MSLRTFANRGLDKLARPTIQIGRASRCAFRLCGCVGLVCACMLATGLMARVGLHAWVASLLLLSSVSTFLTVAMTTKIITGEEKLIYFHQEIAVVIAAAVVLYLIGAPVLPYLDLTTLGLGVFLASGRIGCLMVGCCHGRPHRWGVRYGNEHIAAGFARCYQGVRFFPIQGLESLWVLSVVFAGVLMVVGGQPAGSAFAWYVIAYDIGRFCFEFMRGDPDRTYHGGFSEAQWTSVILTLLVGAGEMLGLLPPKWWHVAAAICMATSIVVIATRRHWLGTSKHTLLDPRHIKELAEAINMKPGLDKKSGDFRGGEIQVSRTTLGVVISAGAVGTPEGGFYSYALSYRHKAMDEGEARILARLICKLRNFPAPARLIKGRNSVYHLLIFD